MPYLGYQSNCSAHFSYLLYRIKLMEHYQIQHNKGGILGSIFSILLVIVGKLTLSDTAMIIAIISGSVATAYTIWKWVTEYNKHLKYKRKRNEKHF